ncbi:riboflavin synthase [Spirochaeta dissipatitropha]
MFTGLVQELGEIRSVSFEGESARMRLSCSSILPELEPGASVAVNGVCQTVTILHSDGFEFDTLAETLKKTTLGNLRSGDKVNLECSLTPSTPMGGHFVQGHVNGTARIQDLEMRGRNVYLRLAMDKNLLRHCIPEGSIAVDGISLTIAELQEDGLSINIIPHTMQHSSLKNKRPGDAVNIETDMLIRAVDRLLGFGTAHEKGTAISESRLQELGFHLKG